MKIILNPTHDAFITLEVENKIFKFLHSDRDSGVGLIRQLKKINISHEDQIYVIIGPGNFTAVRTVCLIANTIKFLSKCKLFGKTKDASEFAESEILEPFYASEAY
jgi:hypothetical protein